MAGRERIGIDLGGTKIAGVRLDGSGAVLAAHRVATPHGDYTATLDAVAALVARLEYGAAEPPTIGIGHPGTLDPATGCVKHCNATWLNGRSFAADLEAWLGRPVRTANDGNCFALSEAVDGAGSGARVVLGIVLGTGCGGGIAVEGRLLGGSSGIAGEIGHTPALLPGPGRRYPCFCGKLDCLEQYASGTALSRRYAELTGRQSGAAAIAGAAEAGEPAAATVFEEFEQALARSLGMFAAALDPEVIVLGGGLSNLARLYTRLPPLIMQFSPFRAARPHIRPPRWGDSSGARGAAWLWQRLPGQAWDAPHH